MSDLAAVLVPAMRRRCVEPFMLSLGWAAEPVSVYAVVDRADEELRAAWEATGAEVILDDGGTFAQRINLGYRRTTQPWLFLVGEDVLFWPGWLERALAAAGERFHVVGTNDRGNPRVMAGEHATHLLVRRTYVDEVGASWDGPGVVCHEGYGHWFCDDEMVTAAKQRGVWTMALDSIVEHRHPMWGKATDDAVYELGRSHARRDQQLFLRRLGEVAHAC